MEQVKKSKLQNKTIKFFLIVFLIVACGCSSNEYSYVFEESDGVLVKKTFKGHRLKGRAEFTLDTVLNGQSIWYFDNGFTSWRKYYSNGLLEGRRESYWKNGRLSDLGNYQSDKRHLSSFHYSSKSGKIEDYSFYFNNEVYLSFDYNEKQIIIDTLIFSDNLIFNDTSSSLLFVPTPPYLDYSIQLYSDNSWFELTYDSISMGFPYHLTAEDTTVFIHYSITNKTDTIFSSWKQLRGIERYRKGECFFEGYPEPPKR